MSERVAGIVGLGAGNDVGKHVFDVGNGVGKHVFGVGNGVGKSP